MSRRAVLAVLGLAAVACGRPASGRDPRPTLVVVLMVDQLRPDYLDRFATQLSGGLGRLVRGGAVLTNAFQDHATTETAPGHAAVLSGRFPSHTGIVSNSRGVADSGAPLVGGGGPGASPFRFRGTTLVDWLAKHDARSRALSVSRKDRAAILMMGRARQPVFWYVSDGRFTTSSYYADTLPSWVREFNGRQVPRRAAGAVWRPLLSAGSYPEPDSVRAENGGGEYAFPHTLPADPDSAAKAFGDFFWADAATLELALRGTAAMGLGRGPAPDVLAISLSATDAVGHRYGPGSREIHDQVLRLDRMIGSFLDSLYRLRDSASVVVVLSADHGVTAMPELAAARDHRPLQRIDLSGLAHAFRIRLAHRGLDTTAADAFLFQDAMLVIDRGAFRRARIDADSTIGAFRREVLDQGGVERADIVSELARADTTRDMLARRWLHSLPPDTRAVLVVTLREGNVWGSGSTAQHGSPWDDDAHVPLVFYGPPFRPGRYGGTTRVVDIAPTLAFVLGVTPPEVLDGRPLRDILLPRSAGRSGGD